jgi:hypothetical protein
MSVGGAKPFIQGTNHDKLVFTITLFMLVLLPLQSALAAPAQAPSFNTLVGFTNITTVNIVFVGYEPGGKSEY